MNVTVILCNGQIIQNCEETAVCRKVKIRSIPSVAIYKAVLTDVLTVQLKYKLIYVYINTYLYITFGSGLTV